ncbi:MAG: CopD family protein [Armatimonadota bacterium]
MTRPALLTAVVVGLLALLLWSMPADPAEAHALLVRSDPAENSELQVSPDQVIGFFSEPLDERLSSLEVLDGAGERVDSGKTTFGPEPERMSIGIPQTLAPGFYTVVWETLSTVDGHLFKGSYPFTVLNEDGSQPSGPRFEAGGGGAESTDPDDIFVKWSQLVAATLLVGALAFVAWVSVPSTGDTGTGAAARRAVRLRMAWLALPAAVALALAGGGELLLQAGQLGGVDRVGDVLKNTWGERWIQRQLVLAGIFVALLVSVGAWRSGRVGLSNAAIWVGAAGGFAYLLLVAMVSHGAAVPGSFWAVGADFLHLSSTAVWVGMLAMLALFIIWLRGQPASDDKGEIEARHLQRFSLIAATSVVILLATGTINGLTQVPNLDPLIDTAYGRVLIIKLGLMAALLAVAGVNAFYLRPRAVDEAEEEGGVTARTLGLMRLTVVAEILLAFSVLAVAALLIQNTTARQEEQVQEAAQQAQAQAVVGFEGIQPAGDLQVNLTISPNTPGPNSFRVFLFPQEGGDIGEVLRVRLRFQSQESDLGVSDLELEPAGATAWKGVGPFLSEPGTWTVGVDVRRADIDDILADFSVPVESGERAGGDYDLPLAVGSWLTVAAIGLLVAFLLAGVWLSDRRGIPEFAYRPLRTSIAAFSVIAVGVLAISFLPGEEEQAGNPIASTSESIAVGRTLYAQNCMSCHGQNGRGDGPLAPTLSVPPADFRVHIPYHQDDFFFRVMTNGLGTIMPSFGAQLTEEERWHLLNFLQSEYGAEAQQSEQQQ